MGEEEQKRFQELVAQGANREEKLEPNQIPQQMGGSPKKKSARDIKLLMRNEQAQNAASVETASPTC